MHPFMPYTTTSANSAGGSVAACLPVEVQQLVCSFLNSRSFYAARRVCRWWYYASLDKLALVKQLNQLPIQPALDATRVSLPDLQEIYAEAARTLMLGIRVGKQDDESSAPLSNEKAGYQSNAMPARPYNGCKMVAVNSQKVALLTTYFGRAETLSEHWLQKSSDNDSEPWDKVIPTSCHDLTLSKDGRLLAVAQERAIQIFSLSDGIKYIAKNNNVATTTSHYIRGLDFVLDDHLLRVRLSEKGAVLYLGSPSSVRSDAEDDIAEHWSGARGLKHRLLESSLLTIASPTPPTDSIPWMSAVELLRPCRNGYLFAAQRHGGTQSSHYILGHVKCSPWHSSGPVTVDPTSVVELARLESFLSSSEYSLDPLQRMGMAGWNGMPSAHEHHPKMAMSLDGTLIIIAEREKKRVRSSIFTQLFVYRLPSHSVLLNILKEKRAECKGQWATLSSFLDTLETGRSGRSVSPKAVGASSPYTIARIPLCLGSIEGDEPNITVERVDREFAQEYHISGVTSGATATWKLRHL